MNTIHDIRIPFFLVILILFTMNCYQIDSMYKTVLWQQGQDNYNGYRIPSLIVTTAGTLLAFCEGREGGDSGDIDLLIKRSTDNGTTWSRQQIVWDHGKNTCGNPCPVVDQQSGRIWLFMTWNLGEDVESQIIRKESKDTRRVFLCFSDDDGLTWSEPVEVTETCKDASWGWYATGPGIGIQLTQGKYSNRLIIPANHSYDDPDGTIADGPFGHGAHALISDDYGKTWRKSQPIRPGCNESQIVELSDGTLMMNMRSYNNKGCRAVSKSTDGGETWLKIWHDTTLVESRCQASILRYGDYNGNNLILFSNPAVKENRKRMTVRGSRDNGNSWSEKLVIYKGFAAYSCLTRLPDGQIGLLYEHADNGKPRYHQIRFVRFPVQLLTAHADINSD